MFKANVNRALASTAVHSPADKPDVSTVDENKSEPTTDNAAANIDGEAMGLHARELGGEVSKATEAAVIETAEHGEKAKGGVFRTLFGLQADFGDKLALFPVPDSEEGNNPDWFKVEKTNAKGEKAMVWTTFYAQFALGSSEGQKISERIEWTERAGMANVIKDDIPRDILDLSPHERETHLNFLTGRMGTLRKQYKDAVKLALQFDAVREYPGVNAEPIWCKGKSPDALADKDGSFDLRMLEVENTTKPIAVWLVPDEGRPIAKWESLSIGAFLKLRPKSAEEKGGTFQQLIDSAVVKRKPGAATGRAEGEKQFTIKTVDTSLNLVAELHRYLVGEVYADKSKAEIGKLYKKLNEKDNDEMVTAIVELSNALNDWRKECKLDDKYVRLQQAGSDLVKAA